MRGPRFRTRFSQWKYYQNAALKFLASIRTPDEMNYCPAFVADLRTSPLRRLWIQSRSGRIGCLSPDWMSAQLPLCGEVAGRCVVWIDCNGAEPGGKDFPDGWHIETVWGGAEVLRSTPPVRKELMAIRLPFARVHCMNTSASGHRRGEYGTPP